MASPEAARQPLRVGANPRFLEHLDAAQRLAAQAGLPQLREYVVEQHIVLYAHPSAEVALLALKHQKQLYYPV